jgi:hypothetical protein
VVVINARLATDKPSMVASILLPLLKLGCKLSVSGFGTCGSELAEIYKPLPLSYLSRRRPHRPRLALSARSGSQAHLGRADSNNPLKI